jgi:hypothetical protein
MDEFDDTEITKLLRLKRYEQPPPGYFENFLHEFHRRQRDELLRQPLWRICFDRACDFVFQFNLSKLTSYPAAVAAVLLCAAVISIRIYQMPTLTQPGTVAVQNPEVLTVPANTDAEWTLASPVTTRVLSTRPLHHLKESGQTQRAGTLPHYVLDNVPVSYETTFKF